MECVAGGEEGTLHDVRIEGEHVGTVCVTDAVGERLGVVTPGMVLTEFRRLSWPASELVVQPPRGRIPVNLDGYFFTRDTEPLTQTVTLLGRRIQIEATPEEFTWHFGDGTTATTASPGGPYPGGDVTHRYTDDGDVTPSLDTTYRGRYRVDGGAWTAIPATHTVTGEPQTLDVITVDLELVDPGGAGSPYRCGSYC